MGYELIKIPKKGSVEPIVSVYSTGYFDFNIAAVREYKLTQGQEFGFYVNGNGMIAIKREEKQSDFTRTLLIRKAYRARLCNKGLSQSFAWSWKGAKRFPINKDGEYLLLCPRK